MFVKYMIKKWILSTHRFLLKRFSEELLYLENKIVKKVLLDV
jgi:hypothetical protein